MTTTNMFEYQVDLRKGLSSLGYTSKEVQDLAKALDTSTSHGNNYAQPNWLSRVVTEQIRLKPILRNAIYREAWSGTTYNYDLVTASPNTGLIYVDGGTIPTNDITLGQASVTMSRFGVVGYVSNPAIEGSKNFIDVLQLAINERVKQIMRAEEAYLFNGDSNYAGTGLIASVTNTNGASANLTFEIMNNAVVNQVDNLGYSKSSYVWVVSPNVKAYLQATAFNKQRFIDMSTGSITLGFQQQAQDALIIGGVPVISSYAVPSGQLFLLSLDPSDLVIPVQKDIMVEPIAEQATVDAKPFRVKQYSCLCVRNPLAHLSLSNYNISNPANF